MSYQLIDFDLPTADDRLIESWFQLQRNCKLESIPDEPVFTRDELVEQILASMRNRERHAVCAVSGESEVVGTASVSLARDEKDSWPPAIRLNVHPDHRRRGLGTRLLADMVQLALGKGCRQSRFFTCSAVPAGGAFMERYGGRRIVYSKSNRLSLDHVDDALIQSWLSLPSSGRSKVTVADWNDSTPEDRWSELVDFYQAVYDAERGEPGFREHTFTEDDLRIREKAASGGSKRWLTLACLDHDSGALLGITEISWFPARPDVLRQGYTAVLPRARRRGIGRRLKAEMVLHIGKSIPGARFIRSENADHKDAILGINRELGYECTHINTIWEAELEPVRARLSEAGESLR